MTDEQPRRRSTDNAPDPDPSKLTQDAVDLAVLRAAEADLAQKELLEARFDANDKLQTERLQTIYRRIVETVAACDREVEAMNKVMNERFERVFGTITATEANRREAKVDDATQLAAALSAAKELVTQSQANFDRLISALGTSIRAELGGVTTVVNDLKERVVKIEAGKVGATEQRQQLSDSTKLVATLAGLVLTIISVISVLAAAGVFKGN